MDMTNRQPLRDTSSQPMIMNAPLVTLRHPEVLNQVLAAQGIAVLDATDMTPDGLSDWVSRLERTPTARVVIALRIPRESDYSDFIASKTRPTDAPSWLADPAPSYHEALAQFEALFERALSLAPWGMMSLGGGFREPQAEALEQASIFNIGVATNVREAKVLLTAGVDMLVAQGTEAAGPYWAFEGDTGDETLLTLIARIARLVRRKAVPLLAWGGIQHESQIQALKALGASGVVCDTALYPYAKPHLPQELVTASELFEDTSWCPSIPQLGVERTRVMYTPWVVQYCAELPEGSQAQVWFDVRYRQAKALENQSLEAPLPLGTSLGMPPLGHLTHAWALWSIIFK